MKPVPGLEKMRTVVSDDGRVARFYLMFKGGQHSAFALSFSKIGLLLTAVRSTIATMSARLSDKRHEAAADAEISEGLAEALAVKSIVPGRNEVGENFLISKPSTAEHFHFG